MAIEAEIVTTADETTKQVSETMLQLLMYSPDARYVYAAIISTVIPEHCKCSTAKYAPNRLGTAFATGRINQLETLSAIAGGYALCDGVANKMCYYK